MAGFYHRNIPRHGHTSVNFSSRVATNAGSEFMPERADHAAGRRRRTRRRRGCSSSRSRGCGIRGVSVARSRRERKSGSRREPSTLAGVGVEAAPVADAVEAHQPDGEQFLARCARVSRPRTRTTAGLQRFGETCGPAQRRGRETRAERGEANAPVFINPDPSGLANTSVGAGPDPRFMATGLGLRHFDPSAPASTYVDTGRESVGQACYARVSGPVPRWTEDTRSICINSS